MDNLLKMAVAATEKNVSTRARKKSICDALHEILFDGKASKTKTELVAEMSLERLKMKYPELDAKKFATEQVQAEFTAINKTVKNGFEAAVCNGSTNAQYGHNPKFKKFTLERSGEHDDQGEELWHIVKK